MYPSRAVLPLAIDLDGTETGSTLTVCHPSSIRLTAPESTDLIPLSGDIAKTTRRAEEFRGLHEALQKKLWTYLPLTMDALSGVHQRVKSSMVADATKQ